MTPHDRAVEAAVSVADGFWLDVDPDRVAQVIRAALAAYAAEGWKLTQATATEDMVAAGWIDKEDVTPAEIWSAMHDAAHDPTKAPE